MGDTTLSYAVGNKGAEFSLAGLPFPHREHLPNWGPVATAAGLPSPSSLARCHLSQSERPWQSAKFRVWNLCALLPQGELKALRSDFTPLPRAPTLGELDAVRRPERVSPAEAAQGVSLDSANDGADFRKPQSKLTRCVLVCVLALSVIAPRCHLSQSERPWQSAKFSVYTLRPAAARGAVRRCAQTFRLCQGLPLWGSWREAPERARTLTGPLGPSLAGACDGADFRKA